MICFLTKTKAFVIGHRMLMKIVTVSPQNLPILQPKHQLLSPVKTVFTRMRPNVINSINAQMDTDGPIKNALNLFFSHLSLISVNTHVTSFLNVTIAVTSNIAKTESIPSQVTAPDFSCAQTVFNGKTNTAPIIFFLTKMKAFVIGHRMSMKIVTVSPQNLPILQPKHQLLSPVKTVFTRMRPNVINFINAQTDIDGPIRNALNLFFSPL